jgi:phosphohistidine phosphatase
MRRLMLLRHAKADRAEPGESDYARPLTLRGEETAARVGVYLARHGLVPDRVLCSPSRRTKETWAAAAKELGSAPPVAYEGKLYDATSDTILALIRETETPVHSLLVIGHNPGLQEFAVALIASGDVEVREHLHEKLPTSGLVVIDLAIDAWTGLHRKSGRLDRLLVPRALDPATD